MNLCLFQGNDHSFYEQYCLSNILAQRYSGRKCSMKEKKVTHINADIVICDVGNGQICFSKPSIELSYADLEQYFPTLKGNKSDLKQTVHRRDCLFLDVFMKLLK